MKRLALRKDRCPRRRASEGSPWRPSVPSVGCNRMDAAATCSTRLRLGGARARASISCLAATLCLLSACGWPASQPDSLGVNYVEVSPEIGTAGMLQPDHLEVIEEAGYRTVINLASPAETGSLRNEAGLAARYGMSYYSVPVEFARPAADDYRRFAEILRRHAGERVYVHCQMNFRASVFVFLYRALELGIDVDRAYDDVLRIWQPTPRWRSFIDETLTEGGAQIPIALWH